MGKEIKPNGTKERRECKPLVRGPGGVPNQNIDVADGVTGLHNLERKERRGGLVTNGTSKSMGELSFSRFTGKRRPKQIARCIKDDGCLQMEEKGWVFDSMTKMKRVRGKNKFAIKKKRKVHRPHGGIGKRL